MTETRYHLIPSPDGKSAPLCSHLARQSVSHLLGACDSSSRSALIGCHAAAAMAGGPCGTVMSSAPLLINTAHGLTFRGQLALTSCVSPICTPTLTSTSTSGRGGQQQGKPPVSVKDGVSGGNWLIWSTVALTQCMIPNSFLYIWSVRRTQN